MERVCYATRRLEKKHSASALLLGTICLMVFIALSSFIKVGFNGLRAEYMVRLQKEREVKELSIRLKAEHSVLMQSRLLAMRAERLGLKKPKEEEVLSVR